MFFVYLGEGSIIGVNQRRRSTKSHFNILSELQIYSPQQIGHNKLSHFKMTSCTLHAVVSMPVNNKSFIPGAVLQNNSDVVVCCACNNGPSVQWGEECLIC